MSKHILSMLVAHQVGVLARITSIINRKLLNIECMSIVGDDEKKRITVMVQGDEQDAALACKLISNMEDAYSVVQLAVDDSIAREIMLAKVSKESADSKALIELSKQFDLRLLRQTEQELVIEFIGSEDEVNEFFKQIQRLSPTEVSRAGICFSEIPQAGIAVMVN